MKNKLITFIFLISITSFSLKGFFGFFENNSKPTNQYPNDQQAIESESTNNNKNGQTITHNNFNNSASVHISISEAFKLENLKEHAKKIKEVADNAGYQFKSLAEYIKNNKWFMFKVSLASSYISLQMLLVYLNNLLTKKSCWSNWKKHLDLEDLYQISQDQLSKDLLNDIQKRYITFNNPTDFIMPLIKFMREVEKEEKAIALYKNIVKLIQKSYIGPWLFFYNKKLSSNINQREKKLRFIKNSFLSWLANFKINTNTQSLIENSRY